MTTVKPLNARTSFILKLIFVCLTVVLLFFAFNGRYSSAPSSSSSSRAYLSSTKGSCAKLPSVAIQALVHYATYNITPQQTFNEVSVTANLIQRKGPGNFLVFGLGHDSLLWNSLNFGGRTMFLEEDQTWINNVLERFPGLEVYHVRYNTKNKNADDLLKRYGLSEECRIVTDPRLSNCVLSLKGLPAVVYQVQWDFIMVDAPTGYHSDAPGRMTAIFTTGLLARNRVDGRNTEVLVHDVDRSVEDNYSLQFLCKGYMKHTEGKLRHFSIPSQIRNLGSFCP